VTPIPEEPLPEPSTGEAAKDPDDTSTAAIAVINVKQT
jgi:hypothetical protein